MNSNRSIPWFIAIVSLIGAVLAATSIYVHLQLEYGLLDGPSFCSISPGINCEAVYQSKWGSLFGIPLGAFGIPFYVLVACFGFLAKRSKMYAKAGLIITCISCLVSIYLFIVSKFYIKSLCLICIGMYLIHFILFGLFVYFLKSNKGGSSETFTSWLFSKYTLSSLLISFVVFVLAVLVPPQAAEARFQEMLGEMIDFVVSDWEKSPKDSMNLAINKGSLGDFTSGNNDAPVQIVEFVDYECPFCRELFFELKQISSEFGEEKVQVVLKNYPLDNSCNSNVPAPMHEHACYAAELARCAGEQGQFWEMASVLFSMPELEEQSSRNEVNLAVESTVESLGLDSSALNECLESDRQLEVIKKDIQTGNALRLQATPSVWINGRKISLVSSDTLRATISHILK